MFTTKLLIRSLMSAPITVLLFALGWVAGYTIAEEFGDVHHHQLPTSWLTVSVLMGLALAGSFYYYQVWTTSFLPTSADMEAIRSLGFDGRFPSAYYMRPFRTKRGLHPVATITPGTQIRMDIGTDTHNGDASLIGTVVVLDYVIRGRQRAVRRGEWVRNPYLTVIAGDIKHYRRLKREYESKRNVDGSFRDESHWRFCRYVRFRVYLLDREGRHVSSKARRLKFGRGSSAPIIPAYVIGTCPAIAAGPAAARLDR